MSKDEFFILEISVVDDSEKQILGWVRSYYGDEEFKLVAKRRARSIHTCKIVQCTTAYKHRRRLKTITVDTFTGFQVRTRAPKEVSTGLLKDTENVFVL